MDKDKEYLNDLRHSCAHLLAAAVKQLYPGAHNAIGPAIENGFYQDFDMGKWSVSESDLPKIEQKMRELLRTWRPFEEKVVSDEQAKKDFSNNPYKLELIDEFAKEGKKITENNPGNFPDLCKGGHSKNPKDELKHFKLLSIAGAYWRGNEKNKMLTRIYGTLFLLKDELNKYLWQLEEAKKRDHRKIGKELDLFTFSDLVGKGLPLFTPKGTLVRELLNDFSQELRLKRGFQKVWIPHIAKNDLYKVSGHWDKFGDELFLVNSQETSDQMVLKPMNCPHHQQIYAAKLRSYKDLPIKYMETTAIYRDEKAGEMIGLSRVRSVTQDDSHSFCTPEQIKDLYSELIEITKEFFDRLGMKYKARISLRDPKQPKKYLGDEMLWEKAQSTLLEIAKANKLDFYVAEGEAAFYGPKIDFMVLDALGREWQLATPQLDFVQPKRFGLTYTDSAGKAQTPVMIHFALMGSIERFLSVYIEHTAGIFPVWLSPVQVAILSISDKHIDYARKVKEELEKQNIRTQLDRENRTIGAKIRESTLQKIPYMIIIGDKEVQSEQCSVRTREGKDLGKMRVNEFIQELKSQIEKFQ
ncbi:threonine--tRNA ligase [Candidatus Roizmanbacteria bacterium RIFCSPHIGHO2_02_FULL_39_9]|uniref:Threonine--tRNA ligase n=1 Tax=Candidatus Roizmanbacteria bacterium RIFCSPHIGHO2_02_FULL_39_9 TaxID=1802040 RepID=A0A1F7HB47_9BACT|nr:MAG: threonine--tRNA ligase [Candidatus Roizmanbacteria bacterium RIFCSPHIGHO2_02_FULL_39_9]